MEDDKSDSDVEPTLKQPIIENAIYERQEAINLTGFSLSTLLRAEKAGKLQRRRVGRRRFYFGIDLLRWLSDEE